MLKLSSTFIIVFISLTLYCQSNWQWTELNNMPFKTSNNAVCEAIVGGNEYVYSFGGMDTSKIYSGIHPRSFKYDVALNVWTEIDTLPDTEPKIASAASFVKGKIYIIGGYHVYANGTEVSSNKVHIYNPAIESFESDGAGIPVAIDDHVQCVYKDSLIFIVTGWSNSGNVPNVQIYDPSLNSWQAGTNVTNNAFFTAFGASGAIIGDTLYYHGGASGGSFGARKYMRKGYINPTDPTDITWSQMIDAPGNAAYRSACSTNGNTIFWVGGSPISYNFDGIAYNGSGGVDPSARIMHFNNIWYGYADEVNQPYGVMDLRGIAKLSNDRWIICGGMDTNQVVSNRTFLLENGSLSTNEINKSPFLVKDVGSKLIIETNSEEQAKLVDLTGNELIVFPSSFVFEIRKEDYKTGIYYFIQASKSVKIRL